MSPTPLPWYPAAFLSQRQEYGPFFQHRMRRAACDLCRYATQYPCALVNDSPICDYVKQLGMGRVLRSGNDSGHDARQVRHSGAGWRRVPGSMLRKALGN